MRWSSWLMLGDVRRLCSATLVHHPLQQLQQHQQQRHQQLSSSSCRSSAATMDCGMGMLVFPFKTNSCTGADTSRSMNARMTTYAYLSLSLSDRLCCRPATPATEPPVSLSEFIKHIFSITHLEPRFARCSAPSLLAIVNADSHLVPQPQTQLCGLVRGGSIAARTTCSCSATQPQHKYVMMIMTMTKTPPQHTGAREPTTIPMLCVRACAVEATSTGAVAPEGRLGPSVVVMSNQFPRDPDGMRTSYSGLEVS